MRYIDDMIKGIPLEEMTGDTGMTSHTETETVQAIIPDTPCFVPEPLPKIEINVMPEERPAEQSAENVKNRKDNDKKHARIRSRFSGVIAAVLALAVISGGTLVYLGTVKHTGPLAALGRDSSSYSAEDQEKADMLARDIFVSLNDYAGHLISDGRANDVKNVLRPIRYVDLSDLDAASIQLIDNMTNLNLYSGFFHLKLPETGEFAFYFANSAKLIAVEWRETPDSPVGYYPEEARGVLEDQPFGDLSVLEKRDKSPNASSYFFTDPPA